MTINKTTKNFIIIGAILMALCVALGAFGAHGLKNILHEEMLKVYHTGVEYQFYHSLGILFIAFLSHIIDSKKVKIAGYLMFISIVVFSGSLYILTLTGITIIGAITPIGGVGFIVSWILVALSVKDIKSL